jgi:hypothetical protein
MRKSTLLYIFGFIIIIAGIFLISLGFTGNYGVSVIIFPIPFIFTFGKPVTLISSLTLIMAAIMMVLFLAYIIIIFYLRRRN